MVIHWSLNDSKSPQVSRTLLSILVDLNNAIVWIVSTLPLITKSSSPCTNPMVTVPSAPISLGITVTFMFHRFFFSSPSKSRYLSLFSLWVLPRHQPEQQSPLFGSSSFFLFFFFFFFLLLTIIGLVVWPRLDDSFVPQNHNKFCTPHFLRWILDCAYTICSYGEISISCTIPNGSPSPPSHV